MHKLFNRIVRLIDFHSVFVVLLALVPLGFAALAQYSQIGYATTIAGQVALSDSAGWQACSSSLFNFAESVNTEWCMRRPLAIPTQAILWVFAPNSVAALFLLQTFLIGLTSAMLALAARSILQLRNVFMYLIVIFFWWPTYVYGSNFGPEGVALLLTTLAAFSLLVFFRKYHWAWGLFSGALTILVLAIRPGNVLLTIVIVFGIALLIKSKGRGWGASAGVLIALILIWNMPNRIISWLGYANAGHGANFWATVYSAATPEIDQWTVAYEKFAEDASRFGTESEAFGEILRSASIELVMSNPGALLQQLIRNIVNLNDTGLYTRTLAFPSGPNQSLLDPRYLLTMDWGSLNYGQVLATLLWLLSLIVPLLIAIALLILFKSGRSTSELKCPTAEAARWRRLWVLYIGVATYFGSYIFFALVGHDEGERHLVQNVPYLVLAAITAIAVITNWIFKVSPSRKTKIQGSSLASVFLLAVIAIPLLVILIDGRKETMKLIVYESCTDPRAGVEVREVVAAADLRGSNFIKSPASWRQSQTHDSSFLFPQNSWIVPVQTGLPVGSFVTLRSLESGETNFEFIESPVDEMVKVVAAICFEPLAVNAPQRLLGQSRRGVVLDQAN